MVVLTKDKINCTLKNQLFHFIVFAHVIEIILQQIPTTNVDEILRKSSE